MRKTLFTGDPRRLPVEKYDAVVIGTGIAGLYTALHLSADKKVALLTKVNIEDCNSWLAQGGIAAVLTKEDTFGCHIEDTLKAGAGLCKREAVEVLVAEGPENIHELIDMDVPFDLDSEGALQITREGGHQLRRIVHCGGDATGRETTKRLSEIVMSRKNLDVLFHTFLVDLLTDEHGAAGLICYNATHDAYRVLSCRRIVIATGGAGQLFRYTTNPVGAVGDGISCAMRVGATVSNMEMLQFHPTTLIPNGSENARMFLISEAVRGEGGILRNSRGEAFMQGKHEMADLAPRDIVTREILKELGRTGDAYANLDVSSMTKEFFAKRFPTISAECERHGISLTEDAIPVRPAQHYLMGGIDTDLHGETNIPGLFACGECACTGIHGANRLASNSVLECLVFGRRCARRINEMDAGQPVDMPAILAKLECPASITMTDSAIERRKEMLKDIMSTYLGAVRTRHGMEIARNRIDDLFDEVKFVRCNTVAAMELLNMAQLAKKVVRDAIARKESVGAHYIED